MITVNSTPVYRDSKSYACHELQLFFFSEKYGFLFFQIKSPISNPLRFTLNSVIFTMIAHKINDLPKHDLISNNLPTTDLTQSLI